MDTNPGMQPDLVGGMTVPSDTAAVEKEITDIATIHKQIRTQNVSPVEVVSACLRRIERLNPKLNAFIAVLADQALGQARLAEAEIKAANWRGPLHGIPVGIKDFYDTAGIKTTAAFAGFKDRVPGKDAAGVVKLKNAGAIIIGKMNMHRLGMGTTGLESDFGPVVNPHHAEYIPGGSSAGSAAAVACGMCYATLDTDAIGSCRLPAACCGVVGFKGTYGLIDPQGILDGEEDPGEMIRWFSHPGITTRTVEDAALVLNVLAEPHEPAAVDYFDLLAKDKDKDKEGKVRIGVAENFRGEPDVLDAFKRAVQKIRRLGCPMKSVAVPFRHPGDGIGNIKADRKAIAGQTFKEIDLLLLPTTTTTVPPIRAARANPQALSPENTVFANYYGLPALSIPCGVDRNGLPLGLQIVGKPWDDARVLNLAYQYAKLS
jgi:aspartyl-tRNA(Asn)/glutamyl-tRNA(Gln) amidotransferase subunit A